MPIQVLERVGDTALAQQQSDDPDDPLGITPERVDSYTLTIIQKLFPSPTCGVEFLALLLRLARVKQLSLEEGKGVDLASVAVISIQSIKQLATLIGWSYESTHKYVVLFCALGLLRKQRNAGKVELHFSLSRYSPPELDALNALIDQYRHPKRRGKTDKRLKYAERVRQRFLLLYGQASIPQTTHPAPSLIEAIGDIISLRIQLPENLHAQVDSILQKLARAQEQLVEIQHPGAHAPGRFSAQGLDSLATRSCRSEAEQGDSSTETTEAVGRPSAQGLDSTPPSSMAPGRLSLQKVDSTSLPPIEEGRSFGRPVDSTPPSSVASSRLSAQEVDSFAPTAVLQGETTSQESTQVSAQTGRLFAQKGEIPAKKVDSEAVASPNVNVITLIESINVNVSTVALFCCRALGENPGKRGIYSKLFREIDNDAQAIAAALLHTLVHGKDGTIRNPAAVFISRCKDYHRQGIPEESAALVERYGQLTFPQFQDALQQKSSPAASALPATTHQTPASLPALKKPNLIPRIPVKASGGMQREEVKLLWSQVNTDQRFPFCRKGIVPLADGTYMILLDNTMTEIVRQVAFYSEHEWQVRSASLTEELFGTAKLETLRELLNKGGLTWAKH